MIITLNNDHPSIASAIEEITSRGYRLTYELAPDLSEQGWLCMWATKVNLCGYPMEFQPSLWGTSLAGSFESDTCVPCKKGTRAPVTRLPVPVS